MAKSKATNVKVTTNPPKSTALAPMGRKPLLRPTTQAGCNYLQFLNTKAEKRGEICDQLKMKSSQVPNDAPIVHTGTGPILCDPFRYVVTSQFFQHFSETDNKYQILNSVMDVDESPGGDFKEYVEVILIVFPPKGQPVPVHAGLKTTKTGLFHKVDEFIREHAAEADGNGVYAGFLAEVSEFEEKTTRANARGEKFDYTIPVIEIDKIGAKEATQLAAAFKDAGFLQQLNDCVESMKARYSLVESKQVS